MSALARLLPQPKHAAAYAVDETVDAAAAAAKLAARAKTQVIVPGYGTKARRAYVPRAPADYGDGGAFPEIHILQYPLNMGKADVTTSKVAQMELDADGKVDYGAVVAQGARAATKGAIQSRHRDLVEKDVSADQLSRPSAEDEMATLEKTRAALGMLVDAKLASSQVSAHAANTAANNQREPVFVRYTPGEQGAAHNSGAQQRIIKVAQRQVDPMEPPKFRHSKAPNAPPSPPVPVMHCR
jgi:SNW domain-containing protein 1